MDLNQNLYTVADAYFPKFSLRITSLWPKTICLGQRCWCSTGGAVSMGWWLRKEAYAFSAAWGSAWLPLVWAWSRSWPGPRAAHLWLCWPCVWFINISFLYHITRCLHQFRIWPFLNKLHLAEWVSASATFGFAWPLRFCCSSRHSESRVIFCGAMAFVTFPPSSGFTFSVLQFQSVLQRPGHHIKK